MSQTFLGVTLFTNEEKNSNIVVGENIYTVYNTLKNEGAYIEVIKYETSNGSQIEIDILEVDIEAKALGKDVYYSLEIDLTKSFISMKKFNELINSWGILEFE